MHCGYTECLMKSLMSESQVIKELREKFKPVIRERDHLVKKWATEGEVLYPFLQEPLEQET